MSNTYQKKSCRAELELMPAEVAVPEQVIVSMAEIAGAAKEGLLALGRYRCLTAVTVRFSGVAKASLVMRAERGGGLRVPVVGVGLPPLLSSLL